LDILFAQSGVSISAEKQGVVNDVSEPPLDVRGESIASRIGKE
jgi:hypothetical protein